MTAKTYNVLFLCTANSARSILAEAVLRQDGQGRFKAFSAGSHPTGEVHPTAIATLETANYDTGGLRSKSWEEFSRDDAPRLDFVFTVCDDSAGEPCPAWPGQPMSAHWGVPDPAKIEGDEPVVRAAFYDSFRMLNNRISLLFSLPMDSLEPLSLQQRLDEIGKTGAEG